MGHSMIYMIYNQISIESTQYLLICTSTMRAIIAKFVIHVFMCVPYLYIFMSLVSTTIFDIQQLVKTKNTINPDNIVMSQW
jgi:hypothetical protein